MKKEYGSFGLIPREEMVPLFMETMDFGYENRTGGNYYYDNEKRPDYKGYLLQYTVSGRGFYEKDGMKTIQSKGQLFLCSMPENSRYGVEKGQHWEYIFIHFRGEMAGKLVDEIVRRQGSTFPLGSQSDIPHIFMDKYQPMWKHKRVKRYSMSQWLYTILTTILAELEEEYEPEENLLMERILDWMYNNYYKDYNLKDMADYIGVSQEHVSREFRKKLGVTPGEYLQNIRLEQALRDLLNTTLSIQEIATRNGFSCGNYFTKVFHKKMGMSPGMYRKNGG